jgi:hypothetical protein
MVLWSLLMFSKDQTEAVIDKAALEEQITAGARAFSKLLNNAAEDWTSWEITIKGLRALRYLAFAKAHTSDIMSNAYRQEISGLLRQREYSIYDQIDRPTRSACYKLMDRLEEVSVWYATLPPADKMRRKHPQSIMKYAPSHLVQGGKGHNKPKRGPKKPASSAEVERLGALLLRVIKELI